MSEDPGVALSSTKPGSSADSIKVSVYSAIFLNFKSVFPELSD